MTSLQEKQSIKNNQFNKEDWSSAYQNVELELENKNLEVTQGNSIKELNGTLFKNGPGILERDGQWLHHPFDGDGMISAIDFKDGKATFTNKFVKTKGYLEETANLNQKCHRLS